MEACWAHNPEVRGSKPRSAIDIFVLLFFKINLVINIVVQIDSHYKV